MSVHWRSALTSSLHQTSRAFNGLFAGTFHLTAFSDAFYFRAELLALASFVSFNAHLCFCFPQRILLSLCVYKDPTVDPAIQRMRHEAYSQRRHEMMALVRADRKKIVNAEMKAGMATSGGGQGGPGLTPGAMDAAQAKANASYVEKEEKRLLKMKRRQEKEIQQMVEFEVKMSTIAADREQKAELEAQRVRKNRPEQKKERKTAPLPLAFSLHNYVART